LKWLNEKKINEMKDLKEKEKKLIEREIQQMKEEESFSMKVEKKYREELKERRRLESLRREKSVRKYSCFFLLTEVSRFTIFLDSRTEILSWMERPKSIRD
jgi:CRISPR/Cas system CMR subunit Cmr6 (Cas7 group RAMP superfamily)